MDLSSLFCATACVPARAWCSLSLVRATLSKPENRERAEEALGECEKHIGAATPPASSANSTAQTRNCWITSGSAAIADHPAHVCSRRVHLGDGKRGIHAQAAQPRVPFGLGQAQARNGLRRRRQVDAIRQLADLPLVALCGRTAADTPHSFVSRCDATACQMAPAGLSAEPKELKELFAAESVLIWKVLKRLKWLDQILRECQK